MTKSLEESLVECCNIGESEGRCNSGVVTILDFPNEVLDHIFSFLSMRERIRTEWVCRSWAEFGKNYKWSWPKKLTSEMLSGGFGRDEDDGWSSVLSRCGSSLKEIEIGLHPPLDGPTWKTCDVIGANCPNLASIKFYSWEAIKLYNWEAVKNSDGFLSVTRGCTKLRKFSIQMDEPCIVESDNRATVCLALKECRSLECLELGLCSTIFAEGFLDATQVPLKAFKLEADDFINCLCVAEMLRCRRDPIEQLELKLAKWVVSEDQCWVVEVVHNYSNTLRELGLSISDMSSNNWCQILVPLKHLEVLSVCSSSLIEDRFLRVLADSCKKLRKLNISQTALTDVGMSYLAGLPKLTVLYT